MNALSCSLSSSHGRMGGVRASQWRDRRQGVHRETMIASGKSGMTHGSHASERERIYTCGELQLAGPAYQREHVWA